MTDKIRPRERGDFQPEGPEFEVWGRREGTDVKELLEKVRGRNL